MKVIEENKFTDVFPMKIKCKRVVDKYGFAYGEKNDFCGSELEIESGDIKKHKWSKYPDYSRTDYGVICPICGQFIVVNEDVIPKQILKSSEEILIG